MDDLRIDIHGVFDFVDKKEIYSYKEKVIENIKTLHNKTGKGNDFLGWINLPSSLRENEIAEIEQVADSLKKKVDLIVVIGIGGSYLGTRAISEALSDSFLHLKENHTAPLILYAGNNIGEDYLSEMIELLNNKEYGIVVISKSGTTTEPAIAFRILKNHLEEKTGVEKAKELIIAITDKSKGALRRISDINNYRSFVIPDDVGGRYSVLTPVGLVPLAIHGINIRELIRGAKNMERLTSPDTDFENNPSAIYAATRIALYNKGKKIEILGNYENKLHYFAEWWKQLFGESDGKNNKGIYPSSIDLTADLHSMGQYIQEGERHLIETIISVKNPKYKLTIPESEEDSDQLNYIAGKRIDQVNKMAELGTILAHIDGNVPNIKIKIPELNEYYLGQMIYFFEKACGIGGYLMGINPFNQPGVEAYKKNMFALLGKTGFEKETEEIKKRLK